MLQLMKERFIKSLLNKLMLVFYIKDHLRVVFLFGFN
jgi:hypothetical protein